MGSSYSVTEFQREVWTRKFEWDIKKTGRFMTASITRLKLILISQLWIYIPLPLMIDPTCIKDPDTPHICLQLPYIMPLIIIFVLWPSLLIRQIYFLLMIPTLPMSLINMILKITGWKEDTALVNMTKNMLKKRGSTAPRALIKTSNVITVMVFQGIIQRRGLALCKIKIV